jgi:hypothetical protein
METFDALFTGIYLAKQTEQISEAYKSNMSNHGDDAFSGTHLPLMTKLVPRDEN